MVGLLHPAGYPIALDYWRKINCDVIQYYMTRMGLHSSLGVIYKGATATLWFKACYPKT